MWEFDGLPLHPLIVHAPVVLVPLVAAGMALYVFWPTSRRVLGPILACLAVGAAVTAILAAASGEQLADDLQRGDTVDSHAARGELARLLVVVVAVGTVAVLALNRLAPVSRASSSSVPGFIVSIGAVAATVVVSLAGHSGAQLAWEGKFPPPQSSASDEPPAASTVVSPVTVAEPVVAQPNVVPDVAVVEPAAVDVVLGEWTLIADLDAVPPGATTFRIRNAGTRIHAFRIRTPGSGGDRLEWRSEQVPPGEEILLTIDLPVGSLELDCPIEDGEGEHDELGMESSLTVRADAPPVTAATTVPTTAPDLDRRESAPESAAVINIAAFSFEPPDITVAAGATVTWTNSDPAPHTATGDGFDTGRIDGSGSATIELLEPGVYDYFCAIHPSMTASITVAP